jgi:hypothetical protein
MSVVSSSTQSLVSDLSDPLRHLSPSSYRGVVLPSALEEKTCL